MLDQDESRDEAAVGLAEGGALLAGGLLMVFFADTPPASSKDWLWLGFSGFVVLLGAVVLVRSWRRLWASRRRDR